MKRLPRYYMPAPRMWPLRFWLLFTGLGIAAWSPFALLVLWVML